MLLVGVDIIHSTLTGSCLSHPLISGEDYYEFG